MKRRSIKKSRTIKKPIRKQTSGMLQTFTASELQQMEFPPLDFFVEGIITEGLTLLAGKPKMGKSWMALDLAMSVATGNDALGEKPCKQGPALYCALEDNQRRLQRRMRQIYGDQSNWPKDFHFTTQMNRLDDGGLDKLENWIIEHQPKLVIIDTLVCIRPKDRGNSGYDTDYAALSPLQELAGRYGIAIIVVHHLRKMKSDDPLDMVSGTTGLTGAVDSIFVLHRKSYQRLCTVAGVRSKTSTLPWN